MNFFKKLLGKEIKVTDTNSFWKWFQENHQTLYTVVNTRDSGRIDTDFMKHLMPRLQSVNNDFFCLTGMCDDDTAELIISAEGAIKLFVFVEEFIAAAPALDNWKFTALKTATGLNNMRICMNGFDFDNDKLSFFYTENDNYPDEIQLTIVHTDFTEANQKTITNGAFIYLDNALGELNVATLIDNITVTGPGPDNKELIPISKLNDFLIWKEKEFVEKYDGLRYNTDDDNYVSLQAQDENGLASVAILNQALLEWDAKASHPWLMLIEIDYGSGNNGMPNEKTYQLINQFEDHLTEKLTDAEGYLNLGRETYKGQRRIFFACKEFRNVSKVTDQTIRSYAGRLTVSYTIFKDKYWQIMDQFRQAL